MFEDCQVSSVRAIAFYLPQFHPTRENDEWWGKGFTEWTNVSKAKPLFRGHHQPKLPGDLGFYDLRLPEARQAQANLAKTYGIEGFCYWHYWFGEGRRVLDRPFDEVLTSGNPDFPFCLAWANQTWTGIWHGEPNRVLIEQRYPGLEDEKLHFSFLLRAFRDPRYICVEGRPLFVIFCPQDIKGSDEFISRMRHMAVQAGLPGLFLVAMSNDVHANYLDSYDAITNNCPADFLVNNRKPVLARGAKRLFSSLAMRGVAVPSSIRGPTRYSFAEFVSAAFVKVPNSIRHIPCVLSGWDNTPRSGLRGLVLENYTPELFEQLYKKALKRIENRPRQLKIVFLKAWNEWAEGNYIEPDMDHKHRFLEVIKNNMSKSDDSAAVNSR